MADCGKPVGDRAVSYACYLPPVHEGPCAAKENQRSLRLRSEWEREHTTYVSTSTPITPAPAPREPGALEALGMQGPPKTSVDGLTAGEGRDARREHPTERARRLAGNDEGDTSLEQRLVQHAGAVPVEEMQNLGMHRDPRLDPYDRRDERPLSPPPQNWPAPRAYGIPSEEVDVPDGALTEGERVLQLVSEIQARLNEITRIVSGE